MYENIISLCCKRKKYLDDELFTLFPNETCLQINKIPYTSLYTCINKFLEKYDITRPLSYIAPAYVKYANVIWNVSEWKSPDIFPE